MRCIMQAIAIVDASCVVYCCCINVRELLPLLVLLFELISVYFIKSFEKELAESRKNTIHNDTKRE
ncbi:MAG: hypothetical protein IJK26_10205 [Clostridia bacterium]|nr:hypothetical protein [Clostridia bacterium]